MGQHPSAAAVSSALETKLEEPGGHWGPRPITGLSYDGAMLQEPRQQAMQAQPLPVGIEAAAGTGLRYGVGLELLIQ